MTSASATDAFCSANFITAIYMLNIFEKILTPPDALKKIYYWASGLGAIAFIVGFVVALFSDNSTGKWVGVAVACWCMLAWILMLLFIHIVAACTDTRTELAKTTSQPAVGLADRLGEVTKSVWLMLGITIALGLVVTIEHWILTHQVQTPLPLDPEPKLPPPKRPELPTQLPLEFAAYFDPARDLVKPKTPDFLLRLIERLTKEGNATMNQSKVTIIRTAPLTHPTPNFTLTLPSESAVRELSPIAFLTKINENRQQYEQLAVEYPDAARIVIRVPRAAEGDRVMVLSRVTLIEKNATFPTDVGSLFKFTISQGE